MTVRAAAALGLLIFSNALSLPAAAQSIMCRQRDIRLVPASMTMSFQADAPAAPLRAPAPRQHASRSDALAYGLVGALVGGLATAAYLAYGCSRTECILDPVSPIATGIGIGFVVGFAVGGGVTVR